MPTIAAVSTKKVFMATWEMLLITNNSTVPLHCFSILKIKQKALSRQSLLKYKKIRDKNEVDLRA
jgi:hypothetical protein